MIRFGEPDFLDHTGPCPKDLHAMNAVTVSAVGTYFAAALVLAALVLAGCGVGPAPPADQEGGTANTAGFASIGTYAADAAAAPALGIILDPSGRVVGVEAGGAAQQAGVTGGDTIVTLDGVAIAPVLAGATNGQQLLSDSEAINALRNKIAAGKALKLDLLRNGQPVTLDVTPALRSGQPTPTAVPRDELYLMADRSART